jgi:ABC-type transport system involved in Fe-S cluster assembly fused permease/ATPase subunit
MTLWLCWAGGSRSLSLDWHLRKKMGNTLRAMDRGVESANSVVNYIFLYLVPTVVECLVVIGVFMLHYKSAALALLVFVKCVP